MPKPFSRRDFRERLRRWLRRNIRLVALLTVALAAVLAVFTALILILAPNNSFRAWCLGAFHASAVATYLHLLHTAFLAHEPAAVWQLRGAWGEDNTRSVLQRARRKGIVWGWIDSIDLRRGDIDHLVVTRHGGLVAIDSKWRARVDDPTELARAARRVQLRSEALVRDMLKGDTRGSRRTGDNPLKVPTVVVLWGLRKTSFPTTYRSRGSASSLDVTS